MHDLLEPLAWIFGTLGAVSALLVMLVRIDPLPTGDPVARAVDVSPAPEAARARSVEPEAVPVAA